MSSDNEKTSSRTTEGRRECYDSILDTIGNTPCVRINHLAPEGINLFVKAEFFNPASSVKDRLAVSIIIVLCQFNTSVLYSVSLITVCCILSV